MSNFIEPEMVQIIHQKPEKSMSIQMVHLPKGEFMFGEGSDAKKVVMDYEFEIGKFTVTIEEYMHFVEDTKTHYPTWLEKGSQYNIHTGNDDYYKKMNLTDKAPIIGVSWHDAVAYCEWLSQKSNQHYRLPTEKEWEYACRAETTTKWSFGDDKKELGKYAWYDDNSNGRTHLVGEKLPNLWGLYDMYGNVEEWCEDWYDEDKDRKVVRGGSYFVIANVARSAYRYFGNPAFRNFYMGFRLLRTLS